MSDQIALMHRMWAQAKRYQNLIDRNRPRIEKFGIRRYLLFWRFTKLRRKMEDFEWKRFTYVSIALTISIKLHVKKREERHKRRLDH